MRRRWSIHLAIGAVFFIAVTIASWKTDIFNVRIPLGKEAELMIIPLCSTCYFEFWPDKETFHNLILADESTGEPKWHGRLESPSGGRLGPGQFPAVFFAVPIWVLLFLCLLPWFVSLLKRWW